ncbi:unnamed protein product [Cuscuta campestris]|uniref:ATP-dependent RNA helicase n=1 Tax=Cuscuta campestris TaxID=132261 RepID=A0A484LA88_9ASTE|nr:unnamed protein product [Cuscuta campestris]
MKPAPPFKPCRATPILSRVFPHKLKYRPFRLPLQPPPISGQFGLRKFSTRSDRGASRGGRTGLGGEVRPPKSLVEDEADLSDWVSGLRSDSYLKTRVYSESDDNDDDDGFSGRSRGGGGRGRMGRGGGGGGRGGQLGREVGGGRRRVETGFVDDYDDDEDGFDGRSSGRGRGQRGRGGGGRGGQMGREMGGGRRRVETGFDDFHRSDKQNSGKEKMQPFSREGGRFGRNEGSTQMQRGGRFGNEGRPDRQNSGSDRMQPFQRKGGRFEVETRGGKKRGVDKFESGFRKDRKRRNGAGEMTDEDDDDDDDDDDDEDDNGYKRFGDLLDSEEESEEEEDEEEAIEKETNPSSRASMPRSPQGETNSYLSETRFDQFPLSPLSLKGIKDAGYEKMTLVQEATLPIILKGKDVLAKAKTGTGKTVAFLLPSIEIVLKSNPSTRDQKLSPILVLVVCPTRELASQAAAEANSLLKYHPTIGVQVVIGGTRLALEQKKMLANPCQILVATPGRLKDHIENTSGFATRLMGVKVLVLDEADHLLDMGFRKDIERIIAALPKNRQTLLFSATVPQEVRHISHIALKRDHEFVNTVQEGSEETHAQVQQMYLVAPLDKHFSFLYSMLKDHISDDPNYKVLVFCTTAMVTRLVAQLLGELNLNVREIHSRKPQSYRTRVSDEFRKSKGLILVTSDVSARGVDYPDVTLVIQIGLPSDRQQYIHRLGRTGRKGKEGQGVLMLAPWEEFFLSTVKDLPMTKAGIPLVDPETKRKVEKALSLVEMKNKEAAYQAWLGYYNSNKSVGGDKYRLVELANEFSRSMGLDNPPAIPKLVLGKMGLKNIPGLRSK